MTFSVFTASTPQFPALIAVGYDGWVTVEDFSTAQPLAQRTLDNLAYVRAVHERTRGGAPA